MRKEIITIAFCLLLLAAAMQSPAFADRPTSTNVVFLPGPGVVPDAYSTIQRNDSGIRASVHTGLLESQVYTMWILIWNDAAQGCDPNVDSCAAGPADCVIYGTGHLIGAAGNGHFSTSLGVGDTSRIFPSANCPAGLTDARTAEIHLVIADHGDLDPAGMPAAIKTPEKGVQAAVHRP